MIQTQLEKDSDGFSAGKAALATAMAIVEHEDGSTKILHWSQAVMVREGHAYPSPPPGT
jgi:hypothetical protein